MTSIREWLVRLLGTVRPHRDDADLEAELRSHLELAREDERRSGKAGYEARRAAGIRAGGITQAMESLRDQRGLPWLSGLAGDLRGALHAAGRDRGFTLMVVATLGSSLALCLTVGRVVNGYLIRPMPFPASDRLYSVVVDHPAGQPQPDLTGMDWNALSDLVDHGIGWDLDVFVLLGGDYPEPAPGAWITEGFIHAMGVRAERGRVLDRADFAPTGPPAVMISHRLWVTRFAGDPGIVGRTIKAYVSDRPEEPETLTVVGVLPADFWYFTRYTDVLGPLRVPSFPYLIRLRDRATPELAAERIRALAQEAAPDLPAGWRVRLASFQRRYVEELLPLLRTVAVSVILVLLIACANVAVLLIVRSIRRQHEFAIRHALGASMARLARLLGLEASLLAGGAMAIGLAASALLTHLLAPVIEQRFGRRVPGGDAALAVDATLLVGALAGTLAVATVMTLAPLAALRGTNISPSLRTAGRGATDGRTTRRVRSALIAAEIAAALALLAGSALMIGSSIRMSSADPGFRAAGVLTTDVGLRPRSYPDAASRAGFFARLLLRLDGERGDRSSALSDAWVLQQVQRTRVESAGGEPSGVEAGVVRVSAGYFRTLGIDVLDGRSFEIQDRPGGEPVAVISESLARRLWPGMRAVGMTLRIANDAGAAPPSPHLVVGVVRDVRQIGYEDGQVQADANLFDVFLPLLQDPGRFAFLYTRATGDPDALRRAIADVDAEAAVMPPKRLEASLREARIGPRQLAWLLSGFGAFAALLALLGVYSVIAYAVRQREREIGVRLAVGADPRAVTRLFVREGTPLLACGLAAGIAASAALGRVLQSQLFGVESTAPALVAATTAAFAVCGWIALWFPARRAARLDPSLVLKDH